MAADTWNIKRIWQLAAAIPGEIERTRQLADSWQLPYLEEPNTDV